MKVPKRINELLTKKQEYINSRRTRMERYVIRMQGNLLDELFGGIVADLEIRDGKILETTNNYRILTEVDRLYNKFNKVLTTDMASEIIGTTKSLITFGEAYFSLVLADNMPAKYANIIESTKTLMNTRIGVKGEKIVTGGFLEGLFKDNTVPTKIKDYISKSITGQINKKEFILGLRDLIKGVPRKVLAEGKETVIQTGVLEKQYQRYAYDVYQQYDAAYNSKLADEFDMNYFVYQGGLIDDSRDFCAAHNNKVWTREEADMWPEWTPSKGEYPAGYVVKSKKEYAVPSYLGYPGYIPLVDRGGYNCRHQLGWISDVMAFDLRPDLKT